MGNWQTNYDFINHRDDLHRQQMQAASNALLTAMFRELAAMEARRG